MSEKEKKPEEDQEPEQVEEVLDIQPIMKPIEVMLKEDTFDEYKLKNVLAQELKDLSVKVFAKISFSVRISRWVEKEEGE